LKEPHNDLSVEKTTINSFKLFNFGVENLLAIKPDIHKKSDIKVWYDDNCDFNHLNFDNELASIFFIEFLIEETD
jgi:hypothetical protein